MSDLFMIAITVTLAFLALRFIWEKEIEHWMLARKIARARKAALRMDAEGKWPGDKFCRCRLAATPDRPIKKKPRFEDCDPESILRQIERQY